MELDVDPQNQMAIPDAQPDVDPQNQVAIPDAQPDVDPQNQVAIPDAQPDVDPHLYDCPICLSPIGLHVLLKRCGHTVCATCLLRLMRRPTCPVCRKPFHYAADFMLNIKPMRAKQKIESVLEEIKFLECEIEKTMAESNSMKEKYKDRIVNIESYKILIIEEPFENARKPLHFTTDRVDWMLKSMYETLNKLEERRFALSKKFDEAMNRKMRFTDAIKTYKYTQFYHLQGDQNRLFKQVQITKAKDYLTTQLMNLHFMVFCPSPLPLSDLFQLADSSTHRIRVVANCPYWMKKSVPIWNRLAREQPIPQDHNVFRKLIEMKQASFFGL